MATSKIYANRLNQVAAIWSGTTLDISTDTTITLTDSMTKYSFLKFLLYSSSVSSSNRGFLIIPVAGSNVTSKYSLPFPSNNSSTAMVYLGTDNDKSVRFVTTNVDLLLGGVYGFR